MDKQSVSQIRDILGKNNAISIAVGGNPTLDEMAAALSLYLSLTSDNKKVTIACPTEPIVELSNLVGINKVKTSIGGEGGDLVVSFPYKEGEIDKVSYTLEEGYLNIIVKAGSAGLSFAERDVRYKREGGRVSILFIVGTPRLSDLGNLFNPQTLKETTIINIDNKRENQGYGEVVLVSPNYSSVSEQITKLLLDLNLQIDIDIAQNLLDGISFATENFQASNTSFLAFEMAGVLMKSGALRNKKQQSPDVMPKNQAFFNTPDFPEPEDDYDEFFDMQPPKPSQNWPKPQNIQKPVNQNKPFVKNQPNFQKQGGQNQSQPFNQQPRQNTQQPKTPGVQKQEAEEKKEQDTPPDWLAPKIYKGSSSIE